MVEYSEYEIQNLLFDMGLPANRLGFLYLVYGMRLVLADFEYATRVSKLLYVDIAARYQTDSLSVERCIRHAITVAYSKSCGGLMDELFSPDIFKKSPSPTEFISRLYFHMINNPDSIKSKNKEA